MAPVSAWGLMVTILLFAALALYVAAAGTMTASFAVARTAGSRMGASGADREQRRAQRREERRRDAAAPAPAATR